MTVPASNPPRLLALGTAAALAALCSPNAGLAREGDPAKADELFQEGRQRLARGDVASACPLLAESFRLDPATGALLALALCHERAGQLASAQREYAEVATRSRREGRLDRHDAARERAAALERELSTLTMSHSTGTEGLAVRLNGAVVDAAELGKPMPLDGGDHLIEASAAGKKPWRAHVMLAARGDAKTILIPALEGVDQPPLAALAPPARVPSSAVRSRAAFESSRLSADEWVGLGTIGVGVVGLGIGTVFAVKAATADEAPNESCDGDGCTYRTPGGDDIGDLAVLSLVTGSVLATAGLIIYLSAGSASGGDSAAAQRPSLASTPWVGPHGAGASLYGRF